MPDGIGVNKVNIDQILRQPLRSIKGIGEARAALFQRLELFTVGDVLTHFPRDYEDRSRFKKIVEFQDGESYSFEGMIVSKVLETRPRKGLTISKVSIRDETGLINAVWFNQSYMKNTFRIGERYVFFGRVTRRRTFEVMNPVYEKIDDRGPRNTCRIVPVYPSTGKLTQNVLRSVIRSALELVDGGLPDILPSWIRDQYQLHEINDSVSNIHFPGSDEDFQSARNRLVFEELLLLQLVLFSIKNSLEQGAKGISFGAAAEVQDFIKQLPFTLTGAQERVLKEIQSDMESPKVMNRLVQGDVGSGKTVVALLALYKAIRSGYQGALMVPTEILAEQHYCSITGILQGSGIKIAILTGSQSKKLKSELLEEIQSGGIDLVIGTHALLEENVVFKRLGLVVTDEQHRFGVRQRATLSRKGDNPDILVMTATPIPRTLALILYGDLDISIIDELPPGRKKIETYAVDGSMRERINKFIRKKVAEGRQVYIVCPLVEESDTVEAKSASETAERIAQQDFKDLRVGLIHGKLKPKDKEVVMSAFVRGEIDIMVSTTVIEVGVNVPNATLMVVENAERFGLAQLHQLRGRVGRGEHQSYCILYNEGKNEVSGERMKVMEKTSDGFVISEKDLELRGPGEFFGTRQHGIPDLKIANLYKDMEVLEKAQEAAREILKQDRKLESETYALLRAEINVRFRAEKGESLFCV